VNESSPISDAGVQSDALRKFAADTVRAVEFGDVADSMLEARVTALEEIIAASGPRAWMLRRRLRRQLRASVAGYDWAGGSWRDRRSEAAGDAVIFRSLEGR
jgi:hypothetical protein